jgi:hypothetical protein
MKPSSQQKLSLNNVTQMINGLQNFQNRGFDNPTIQTRLSSQIKPF